MYVVQYNTKYITGTRQDRSLLQNSFGHGSRKDGIMLSKMTCSVENFIEISSPRSYNVYSHSSQNSHTEVWCQVTHIVNTQQNANTDNDI